MTASDWLVIAVSAALLAFMAWYFFGPRKRRLADLHERVQEIEVTVKGGYSL